MLSEGGGGRGEGGRWREGEGGRVLKGHRSWLGE